MDQRLKERLDELLPTAEREVRDAHDLCATNRPTTDELATHVHKLAQLVEGLVVAVGEMNKLAQPEKAVSYSPNPPAPLALVGAITDAFAVRLKDLEAAVSELQSRRPNS